MGVFAKRRAVSLAFGAVIALAVVGWVAARQIRSPARIAAETAAPKASPITVPVVRRVLSTEVIVRGTVRYGAPQDAVLGTSTVKQGGSDLVTQTPRRGARLATGDVAMAVDGRPVFVLPGAMPMHRDLHPGMHGPDVRQLEQALARLGFAPGAVDGRFDAATAAAVTGFYLRRGRNPFGPTDVQLEQLRAAQGAAAQARDAHLQALNTIEQARQTPSRAEVAQARIDALTARDGVDTAVLGLANAQAKLASTRALAGSAPATEGAAAAETRRDQAAADADVATKRSALGAAVDEERIARLRLGEVAPDAPASEREAAASALRQATAAIGTAQADLDAAVAAAAAVRTGASAALGKARADAVGVAQDLRAATAELYRSRLAVRTARAQATLAALRARLMTRPQDTGAMHAISASSAQEARSTQAEVSRLATESRVQVPANEILFFRTLPLRIDAVSARHGSTVSGRVMTVTNSRLAVDSSLSVSDARLVRPGNQVTIEDQDLGIRVSGTVSQVANKPGTNKVDPSRVYMAVTPASGPVSLVGASVKLTIAVKSTRGVVLAVPASALSVGGDGSTRVQVRRGGRTELANVVPGLAATGLVEVRPAGGTRLLPGDLVVVGAGRRGP